MSRRLAFGVVCLLAAGAIGLAAVLLLRGGEKRRPAARTVRPRQEQVRDLVARVPVGETIALRQRPGGRILARVGDRTEFGSVQTLGVALKRGPWLAVRSPALGNTRLGWVDGRRLRLLHRSVWIDVDLSARTLSLVERGTIYRRDAVGIGATDTPTPTGTFYVTDKLPGPRFGPYYGCCILALSGRQPHLPHGWSGGDRLAIHGTPTPTFGQAVTNGCIHLPDVVLTVLMKDVPLGARVAIHR